MSKITTDILYHVYIMKVKIFIFPLITVKHKYITVNSAANIFFCEFELSKWTGLGEPGQHLLQIRYPFRALLLDDK